MTNPLFATVATATLRDILVVMRSETDHVGVRLVQAELRARQPIVTARAYVGWTATRGDYDLDDHISWGKTEADAIADLLEWEADADYWARSEAAEPEGKADDPFEG